MQRGTVAGLIGPNGAGKSTTMRILMGLVQPDSGTVTALGKSISSCEAAAKQDIGYFSDDMRLYKPESIGWHIVIFLQTLLVPMDWPWWFEFSIVLVGTVIPCMATYVVFVRYTPLGWLLHGKRSFP